MSSPEPIQKITQSILRLAAAGLVIVGGMMAALELIAARAKHTEINLLKVGAFSLLCVAGVVLFAGSRKLAAALTGGADESDDTTAPDE